MQKMDLHWCYTSLGYIKMNTGHIWEIFWQISQLKANQMKTFLTSISVQSNMRFQQLNCGNLTYSPCLSCRHARPLQILLIWPTLYCCALPTHFFPQLVLMALLPGTCPGGTGSAGCYLSPVGWLCLSPRHSHTCHFSPSSDLWAFLHSVNLQVQLTHCAHMANANTCVCDWTWTRKSMQECTKAKAL